MYTPDLSPMTTVIRIKKRQEALVNGAPKITYADADSALDCCNWKSKGGTESQRDGLLTYADTASVVMLFSPDISIKDRIVLEDTGQEFEVISSPENIEMRYQYLSFKVQRVGGA
jgi:hypothetical protein